MSNRWWDDKTEQIEFVKKCELNRTRGFEGCKECPFKGFYLCTYSTEGLCNDCEITKFPERYYPCPFCRRPWPHQMMCFHCSIFDALDIDNNELQRVDQNLWELLCNWQNDFEKRTTSGTFIKEPESNPNVGKFFIGMNEKGIGIWKKLKYIPVVGENAIATEIPDERFVGRIKEFLNRLN